MNVQFFSVSFTHDGIHYQGRITPSEHRHADGTPKSYHVILNEVLFGNLSLDGSVWAVDERRPQDLVEVVGEQIERRWRVSF